MNTSWTLITGAAIRLGSAIAKELARRGHSIAIHYQTRQKEAQELASILRGFGVQADTIQGSFSSFDSTQDFIKRYLARFPSTKQLVNNVGNYLQENTSETSPESAYQLFQTNVHAPLELCQAILPSIVTHKGSIVNIGTSGIRDGRADRLGGVYMASKTALWALTKSLAKEFASKEVAVNMVSPGQLDISVSLPKDTHTLPMHRAGSCEEVARLIGFLFEPDNHYITGQNIEVAGGLGL